METSFDVRIWSVTTYQGTSTTTYYVRWKVAEKRFKRGFKTSALADSFRAQLVTAARSGEAFATATGLPVSMSREEHSATWYEFACAYVGMKWPDMSGKSRMGIAETLATVTPALVAEAGRPRADLVRRTLYSWSFNVRRRESGTPPREFARTIRWLETNSRPVADLARPEVIRTVLATIGRRLDGKPAAVSTSRRKRAVLHNALEYAVERQLLPSNPLAAVRVRTQRAVDEVDRRVVVNPEQAARLLAAVGQQGEAGERLVAFFGLLYYAALRPGEAAHLPASALRLPAEGWGELFLPGSAPTTGAAWSDSGRRRDERGLKHRAREAVRVVPAPPPLTTLLRAHLEKFGTNTHGRLFGSMRTPDGDLSDSVYGRVWASAREAALTAEEAASPLARRPYDLRHAAVSTWLNAGVPPTQVAEWAGHSVAVLLRVYAKCLAGQEDAARRRVGQALGLP
ncbi:tyrosine-type recombinase/integrase [Pseudonocardia adelaidensis]|uniref:Tyrosine-type recombinase/integrase n=1 Tax=Pseudonocardia adelaidensis TaxID=648754 RepID=A0ABP9NRL0_9PSEU